MRVVVHGETVEVRWRDGQLSGDAETVARVRRMAEALSIDLTRPASALMCLEDAVGMRPEIELSDAHPETSG